MLILSFLLLMIMIVFLCFEKGRKIKLSPYSAGIIYTLFPIISSLLISMNLYGAYDNFWTIENASDYSISDWQFIANAINWVYVSKIMIQAVLFFPVALFCIAGCFASVQRAANENSDKNVWAKLPLAVSIISTLSVIPAFVCVVIAAVRALNASLIYIAAILLLLLFIVILSCGIGLLIAIPAMFLLLPSAGIILAVSAVPMLLASYSWFCCFAVLHVLSAISAIYVMSRLKKDGLYNKKSFIINSILSFVPIASLIVSINISTKVHTYSRT